MWLRRCLLEYLAEVNALLHVPHFFRTFLNFGCKDAGPCAVEVSKRAAASACKYALPAFGDGPLTHFKTFEMRRDYKHARRWIASYVESECSITSKDKVLRALSDLASGENEEEEGGRDCEGQRKRTIKRARKRY